jgi:hypothetical protein
MKIDRSKHKPSWRVQRGCHVEWFDDRKKGSGIVTKVISEKKDYPWKEPTYVVVSDGLQEITISIDKIRIMKTETTLRKEK